MGIIENGTGTLILAAANTYSGGTTIDRGTLEIADGASAGSGVITFAGSDAMLRLDNPVSGAASFANTLSGLSVGDRIDIRGLAYAPGANATLVGGTLTASSGSATEQFVLSNPAAVKFSATSDGTGGTLLTTDLACFAAGTRIATASGDVPVETLTPGALVLTASGTVRPVRWIGFRHLDLTRHPEPHKAQPIRIRADAFADGAPRRDLLVSPAHAIFHDGRLIPAELLVNGASIVRKTACRSVTYYHVELDTHDILLSEALATESYLDTGNRAMFSNADAAVVLHPDLTNGQARREAASCAPFLDDPAVLEPVWRKLADRAAQLGWELPAAPETTRDPGLIVMADGRRLTAVHADAGRYLFLVPAGVGPVRLVSCSALPGTLKPWRADGRRLGVQVSRIVWRAGTAVEPVALDHPGLDAGWWAAEWHDKATLRRWTDGDAVVPLPLDQCGPWLLEVTVAGTLDYPLAAVSESGGITQGDAWLPPNPLARTSSA